MADMQTYQIENVLPADIERRSMEIIASELPALSKLPYAMQQVVKRVIHTTADFEYMQSLRFSDRVCERTLEVLSKGAVIVTDTQMALSGISKPAAKQLGIELACFMADPDVAKQAKETGSTRAVAAMEKAAGLYADRPLIFAIGNAPTALLEIAKLIEADRVKPELVIGVPVGFVNVVQAKEVIMQCGVPYIVAAGRKGGSTVAAAICNALLYQLYTR